MEDRKPTDEQIIRDAVREINEHWQGKRYERIGALLADEAVIAPPGFGDRVRGRDAYVQSYREYDEAVMTLEFSADEADVDVIGDVAVAVYPFSIVYEVKGARRRETGHDVLVFARSQGRWSVAWRTMQTKAAEDKAG